jgi:hypothetical protein
LNATKTAFEELDKVLDGLVGQVINTIDQIIPHLAEMQSLLSQRGKARKKVLKAAGLPSWPEYGQAYAAKLDCSFRTIQDHITGLHRNGKSGPSSQQTNTKSKCKPLRLDARQQSTIVKAQLAVNDVIDALKSGGDWQTAVAEYDKVAVAPEKLDSFVNTLSPEPDWKAILIELVDLLEEHRDGLPLPVLKQKRAIETMLGAGALQRSSSTLKILATPRKLPKSVGLECAGCEALHRGIAAKAEANPDWSDQQLSEACGCSPTIVRQAKTRFLVWKEAA